MKRLLIHCIKVEILLSELINTESFHRPKATAEMLKTLTSGNSGYRIREEVRDR